MHLEFRKISFGIGNLALIVAVAGFLSFVGYQQHQAPTVQKTAELLPPPISFAPKDSSNPTELAAAGTAQVLGAATYNKDFVNQLDVQVKTLPGSSNLAVGAYTQQLQLAYDNDQVAGGSAAAEVRFLIDLNKLGVPANLADYQKLLTKFYQLDYLKKSGRSSAAIDAQYADIQPQLDLARQTFNQAYGISLP